MNSLVSNLSLLGEVFYASTRVVCFKDRLIFHFYYVANSVDISSFLELLFDQDDNKKDDEYSYLDGTATPALQLFKMRRAHRRYRKTPCGAEVNDGAQHRR